LPQIGQGKTPDHVTQDIKDYRWAMFRHAMEFFKQHASLKKPFPEHYFTNLLKDLSNEDLVTLCELLATKNGKPKRRLYATLRRQAWVLQHDRNKILQVPVN
jgi:hypothetical protein